MDIAKSMNAHIAERFYIVGDANGRWRPARRLDRGPLWTCGHQIARSHDGIGSYNAGDHAVDRRPAPVAQFPRFRAARILDVIA